MKFCKDCKHYKCIDIYSAGTNKVMAIERRCYHPSIASTRDLVTGEVAYAFPYLPAKVYREFELGCGLHGRLYEPND